MRHSEAGPRRNFLLVVVLLPSRRIPIVRGSSSPRARRALTAVETTDTSRNGRRSRSSPCAIARDTRIAVVKAAIYGHEYPTSRTVLGLTPARPTAHTPRRLGPRVTFRHVCRSTQVVSYTFTRCLTSIKPAKYKHMRHAILTNISRSHTNLHAVPRLSLRMHASVQPWVSIAERQHRTRT